jgi:hypothetical protein
MSCKEEFVDIEEAVDPDTGSAEDLFKYVNLSGSGRITKDELVDWFTEEFDISHVDASSCVNANWNAWDEPKRKQWFGFIRPLDQGDLDLEEFQTVKLFMSEVFKASQAASQGTSAIGASASSGADAVAIAAAAPRPESPLPEPRGQKRPIPEPAFQTFERQTKQKSLARSKDRQQKLRDNDGRAWFDEFDCDKNGSLSRSELIKAFVETVTGTHNITSATITGIVDSIWSTIDTDDSGSVDFDEFQMLRESFVAQLDQDAVNAVAEVGGTTTP